MHDGVDDRLADRGIREVSDLELLTTGEVDGGPIQPRVDEFQRALEDREQGPGELLVDGQGTARGPTVDVDERFAAVQIIGEQQRTSVVQRPAW